MKPLKITLYLPFGRDNIKLLWENFFDNFFRYKRVSFRNSFLHCSLNGALENGITTNIFLSESENKIPMKATLLVSFILLLEHAEKSFDPSISEFV